MHRHTYLDTHTHTHTTTTITLFLNSVTRGIWFRLSQEERDRDVQRESVSVSEREKRPLCLCLDLHYHVLILMQFEKETDMETHWVKRGLSVLSGTACSHSPDLLPTHKSRARLHSLRQAIFIHCQFTTRLQGVINTQGMDLHGSGITDVFALQCIEIKYNFGCYRRQQSQVFGFWQLVVLFSTFHVHFSLNLKCLHAAFSHQVHCISKLGDW